MLRLYRKRREVETFQTPPACQMTVLDTCYNFSLRKNVSNLFVTEETQVQTV
jgi:hypothetical protein